MLNIYRFTLAKRLHRLVLAFSFCLSFHFFHSNSHSETFAICDLNRDGTVDFADFIFFANNFGKPLSQQPMTTLDTIVVTTTDTIKIFDRSNADAGIRAGRIMGFWHFKFRIYHPDNKTIFWDYNRLYCVNTIADHPDENGEYTAYAVYRGGGQRFDDNNVLIPEIEIKYNKSTGQYVLWHSSGASMPHREKGDLQIFFQIKPETNDDMTRITFKKMLEYSSIVDSMRIAYPKGRPYQYEYANRDTNFYHASNFHNTLLKRISREEFMKPSL